METKGTVSFVYAICTMFNGVPKNALQKATAICKVSVINEVQQTSRYIPRWPAAARPTAYFKLLRNVFRKRFEAKAKHFYDRH